MPNDPQKNLNILAISYGHKNAAAVLMRQGKPVAAAKEEWFTAIAEEPSFPIHAINFCLQSQNLIINNVDTIVYPHKPYTSFYQSILKHLKKYPFTLFDFIKEMPSWLSEGLLIDFNIRERLGYEGEILFVPNHLAHAANAYFTSPFSEAAFLTIHRSEKNCASWGVGRNGTFEIKKELIGTDEPNPLLIREAIKEIKKKTGFSNFCLSGEFANSISLEDDFPNTHFAPCLQNDGATLGAAYFAQTQLFQGEAVRLTNWDIGPQLDKREIERFLNKQKLSFQLLESEEKETLRNNLVTKNISHYLIKNQMSFSSDFSSRSFFQEGEYHPLSSIVLTGPEDLIESWKKSSATYLLMDQYVIAKN